MLACHTQNSSIFQNVASSPSCLSHYRILLQILEEHRYVLLLCATLRFPPHFQRGFEGSGGRQGLDTQLCHVSSWDAARR